MNKTSHSPASILKVLLFMGVLVGLLVVFQFEKTSFLSSNGISKNSLEAYPAPTRAGTPILISTPIVLENGWFLYIDEEAGYSISYPPEVYFHTSKEGHLSYKTVHFQFKTSGTGYQGIEINILPNSQGLPLENIVQEVNSSNADKPSITDIQASITPIMIGKLSAYKSVYQPSIAEFRIFVPVGDNFLCATPVTAMGLSNFTPQSQELFEKILATLTLNP